LVRNISIADQVVNCYLATLGGLVADTDKGFHAEAFYDALATTVKARQQTWKQVSKETGVSPSTLTRMAQGRRPDAASLAALSAWAGLNPADFVALRDKAKSPEPLVAISTLLRADSNLKPDAAKALQAIIETAYEKFRTERSGRKK
jgi:transcriptional regulator with XRE-family HTH domain